MGLFLAVGRELAGSERSRAQGSAIRTRGFTLIELMIVAAIVAILAAVAYPAYTSHVRKGYRAAAQSYLMDLAQKQSQFLLDNRTYASNETALNATPPADVSNNYQSVQITVVAGPPPSYTMQLVPKTTSTMASDVTLGIDQSGAKTPADKW